MSATATVLSSATSPVKRAESALTTKQERLIKTKGREQVRNALADLRLEKAQERVAELQSKKAETAERMAATVAKQTVSVEQAKTHLAEVRIKAEAKAQKTAQRDSKKAEADRKKTKKAAQPKRAKTPAGVVTASDGKTHELTADQAKTVKSLIGRKKEGILSPLVGEAAQTLLLAVDGPQGSVGDRFHITLKGRKTTLYFEVLRDEEDGVAWWTA